MGIFALLSIIVTLVAIIAYFNYVYIKLPTTLAVLIGSLSLSAFVLFLGKFGFTTVELNLYREISGFDFYEFLMGIALNFMLFSNALNVDIKHFFRAKVEISSLAFFSTIISSVLIAAGIYAIFELLNFNLSVYACLLFSALISPTDPIAVLALLKNVKADQRISTVMSGESLINDGVGIVIFTTCYQLAFLNMQPTALNIAYLFIIKFIGGGLLGGLLGWIVGAAMHKINHLKLDLLVTLALVMLGYHIAELLNVSSPITMVCAGMAIKYQLTNVHKPDLYSFWEVIDDLFNAILFFLIGIELIVISHNYWSIIMSLIAIVVVLISRYLSLLLPISYLKVFKSYPKKTLAIFTFGGIRGGLAVALALSLPDSSDKSMLLTMTYSVVIFSMIFQAQTLKSLLKSV